MERQDRRGGLSFLYLREKGQRFRASPIDPPKEFLYPPLNEILVHTCLKKGISKFPGFSHYLKYNAS
jgi:hypothetical protein